MMRAVSHISSCHDTFMHAHLIPTSEIPIPAQVQFSELWVSLMQVHEELQASDFAAIVDKGSDPSRGLRANSPQQLKCIKIELVAVAN